MTELESYILKHFVYKDGVVYRNDRKKTICIGWKDKDGYLIYKVKSHPIKMHRLVWLLCNKQLPNGEIDHINRVRDDNRIENLRVADRKTQIENTTRLPNKDTGVVGIYLDKSTKGLLAKYSFHYKNKTYRFRNLQDAIKTKGDLLCNN